MKVIISFYAIVVLTIICLVGCKMAGNSNPGDKISKLETFVNGFISRHPEYSKNSIKSGEVGNMLKWNYYQQIDSGILSDYPIRLVKLISVNGSIYGQFQNSSSPVRGQGTTINLDIIANVGKEGADTLVEQNWYYLDGTGPKDYGGMDDYYNYPYSPLFKIDNDKTVDLGITMINLKSIKKVDSK